MYGRRYIICRNKDGAEIKIGEKGFTPFVLLDAEGVYTVSNNIATTENTMMDGATYHGSTAAMRNIVLSIANMSPYPGNRAIIDEVFKERDAGTLFFHEDGGTDKQIDYYVESIDSDGTPASIIHTISLLCPDPFFYAPNDVEISISQWVGLFEFMHEFPPEGEELGRRSEERTQEIMNTNQASGIGMEITVTCFGPVTNPRITIMETNAFVQVGSAAKPFSMITGDKLVITTDTGNKHIWHVRDGEKTEINHFMTQNSTFIQLRRGMNTIGYAADAGEEYVTIHIKYKKKFLRA